MLLLSNNRVSRVADGFGTRLPSLQTLVLTNNRIATLAEIDGLASCQALSMLSLLQNPVNRRKHYRLYVIHKIPSLRVLDFQKIRQAVSSTGPLVALPTHCAPPIPRAGAHRCS
jgi:U2 small nuclear ribonucleoprotein A'